MGCRATAGCTLWIALAAVNAVADPAPVVPSDPAPIEVESPLALAARFADALECAKPAGERSTEVRSNRHWCAVAGLETETFLVPPTRRSYLGVSIGLGPKEPVRAALLRLPEIAVLTIDEKGALVSALPSSAKMKPMAALASLRMVMKGDDKSVHVDPPVQDFLKTLAHEHLHRLHEHGSSASFDALMPSRIYLVKGVVSGFVVLEQDESGTRVNLFPAVPVTTD